MSSLGHVSETEIPRPHQPLRHRSEGLAKLVSKFEILDALSIVESPSNSPRHSPSPHSTCTTLQEASVESQKRHWPSVATDFHRRFPEWHGVQRSRGSSVAERRKLFEQAGAKTSPGCDDERSSRRSQPTEARPTAPEQMLKEPTSLTPARPKFSHKSNPKHATPVTHRKCSLPTSSQHRGLESNYIPNSSHTGLVKEPNSQKFSMPRWEQKHNNTMEEQATPAEEDRLASHDNRQISEQYLRPTTDDRSLSRQHPALNAREDMSKGSGTHRSGSMDKPKDDRGTRIYVLSSHHQSSGKQSQGQLEQTLAGRSQERDNKVSEKAEAIRHASHAEHDISLSASVENSKSIGVPFVKQSTSASSALDRKVSRGMESRWSL